MRFVGLGVDIGDHVRFSKTVGESDIYLFAGITGNFAPNHVSEKAMAAAGFGRRMAHGALLVGFMSTCSTMMAERAAGRGQGGVPLSLGYDAIRFVRPVFIGDTVSVDYRITALDVSERRATATVTMTNQEAAVVAVARHILIWSD